MHPAARSTALIRKASQARGKSMTLLPPSGYPARDPDAEERSWPYLKNQGALVSRIQGLGLRKKWVSSPSTPLLHSNRMQDGLFKRLRHVSVKRPTSTPPKSCIRLTPEAFRFPLSISKLLGQCRTLLSKANRTDCMSPTCLERAPTSPSQRRQ